MIQKALPDTISFLIFVNVHMFSQLLSLYLWDPCCIPRCTCNLEACNKVYIYIYIYITDMGTALYTSILRHMSSYHRHGDSLVYRHIKAHVIISQTWGQPCIPAY